MPQIKQYDAGQIGLRPTEIGVDARAAAARRIGATFNQRAGATDELARNTEALGRETQQLGSETGQLGDFKGHLETDMGRRLGSSVADAGRAAVDYVDHEQIAAGSAHGAQLFNNLDRSMNDAVKSIDPNDPAYGTKVDAAIKQWREQTVEPSLEKFKEGFTTERSQQWAEQFSERTRQQMFQSSAAEVATAANTGVRNAVHQTINLGSQTAFNDPTRGTLDTQLDLLEHSIKGVVSTSPLKGTDAARVSSEVLTAGKESMIKSAVIGFIQKTGQLPPWMNDAKYAPYINGAEAKMFQKSAESQQKANNYYERQSTLLKKQQDDMAVHQAATDLLSKSVTVDPNNPGRLLIAPDFMQRALDIARKNPDAPSAAATIRTVIDWAQSQQRVRAEPVLSDPQTKSGLLTRMFDPNKPTTEFDILKAESDDKISTRDGQILRSMVKELGPEISKDPVLHATIDAAKERVGETVLADGHERFANFMQSFLPDYLAKKRAGTLDANALDLKDPNSLISKSLKTWEPDPKQKMMGVMMKRYGLGGDMNQTTDAIKLLNPDMGKPTPAELPPTDKRVKNQTYDTPRGKMKWTGTGWVAP